MQGRQQLSNTFNGQHKDKKCTVSASFAIIRNYGGRMKTKFSHIVKISSIYVASTIGAAFASGQEIIKFFTRFEIRSFTGILIAGILFAVVAIAALDIVYCYKVKCSGDFLKILGGTYAGKFFEYMTMVFSFCIYIVMIAGAAVLCNRITGTPFFLSVILMSILCTVLVSFNIKGIVTVSEILTPLMIGGMMYLGLKAIVRSQAVFSPGRISLSDNWLVYAFLYVCYNSILNILVMGSMYPWLTSRKTSVYSGMLGGLALFFAMWVLNRALYSNYKEIRYIELPMLEISVTTGKWDFIIYSLILAFALITTAISSGFCFVERMEQITGKPRFVLNICMGILAIPLASQGFSNIIDKIYPLFGYLGSTLFILLIIQWLKLVFGRRKKRLV